MLTCSLKSMREIDLEKVLRWRNSPNILNSMCGDKKITWNEHVKWFKNSLLRNDRENFLFFVQEEAVGVVNFEFNFIDNYCSWSIYIGKENAPKGSGYQMGRVALEYAFLKRKMEKVWVKVLRNNIVSLKFHRKLGFREERIEGCIIKKGECIDIVYLEMLRENFKL